MTCNDVSSNNNNPAIETPQVTIVPEKKKKKEEMSSHNNNYHLPIIIIIVSALAAALLVLITLSLSLLLYMRNIHSQKHTASQLTYSTSKIKPSMRHPPILLPFMFFFLLLFCFLQKKVK